MVQIIIKINDNKIVGDFTDGNMAKKFIDKVVDLKSELQPDRLDIVWERSKNMKRAEAVSLQKVQDFINNA